jgi:hypothetical protein
MGVSLHVYRVLTVELRRIVEAQRAARGGQALAA